MFPLLLLPPTLLALVGEISEFARKMSGAESQIATPRLRKENLIKTITGTLKIEDLKSRNTKLCQEDWVANTRETFGGKARKLDHTK